jgi:hypothetical protein
LEEENEVQDWSNSFDELEEEVEDQEEKMPEIEQVSPEKSENDSQNLSYNGMELESESLSDQE